MRFFKPSSTAKDRRKSKAKSQAAKSQPQPAPSPSLWQNLSPERRLDLIGVLCGTAGILILLMLAASSRSALTGGTIRLLSELVGWGIYVLPIGLIALGLWLILRKIERIPPLSLERAVGIVLLYVWLLTVMHSIIAAPEMATVAAQAGAGGGYIGGLLERGLWLGLGLWGLIIALLAWLLIGLMLVLDRTFLELFAWTHSLRERLIQIWKKLKPAGEGAELMASGNGYAPLPAVEVEPDLGEGAVVPASLGLVKTTTSAPVVHWLLPEVKDILDAGDAPAVNDDFVHQRGRLIEETLASFGAPARVVNFSRGPTITQFGVEPLFLETRGGRTRVRVSKIVSLADDLALALAAPRIRIQAPVPGHSYVGIEVPNDEMTLVALRDIVESETFKRNKSPLRFALGKDVAGNPITANLESMPHLLIAGTTGSGKSVCVNAMLTCFLLHNTPDDLKLVLVDPKRVELTGYNGIPHLFAPVVVEIEHVVGVLQWITREMDNRYHEFARVGARNISDYNDRMQTEGRKKLHFLLIVIDELADLMLIAPDETERTITRLAQLARATGIHMILATQRPSVDVVTGLIKANFPARIAFAVASGVDSRVILDQPGAERLLGRGDMLFQAPDAPSPARLQGVFVSDREIQKLVEFWHAQTAQASPYAIPGVTTEMVPENAELKQKPLWEDMDSTEVDPLLKDAIDLVRREGRASVSMLQRRMRIGYTRAARLVDVMEERGIVAPPEANSQVRQILDYGQTAPPREE